MKISLAFCLALFLTASIPSVRAESPPELSSLPFLTGERSFSQSALWIENPAAMRFTTTRRVVVADITGPAEITMIHFALSGDGRWIGGPARDVRLQIFWDNEPSPSVDVPLPDFYCDPAGLYARVDTVLAQKARGYNAWFPMPFKRRAQVVLFYDGELPPGDRLAARMSAYSYVTYRPQKRMPRDAGYFHAQFRMGAVSIARQPYVALETTGRGKFIGVAFVKHHLNPVDMNEKFFVDGEARPSVELMGFEDAFGFSWGFPKDDSTFPLWGFRNFKPGHEAGAFTYRFFLSDSIAFRKSLKVEVGFGPHESPVFYDPKAQGVLHFSSVCYWYQTEPHAPFPAMPAAAERAPILYATDARLDVPLEIIPSTAELRARHVQMLVLCGRKAGEVVYAEPGFGLKEAGGYLYELLPDPQAWHCRAESNAFTVTLRVPTRVAGTLRLYITDPDEFRGGRREEITVEGRSLGVFEHFSFGRWIDTAVTSADTADGEVVIAVHNRKAGANAVLSTLEWRRLD